MAGSDRIWFRASDSLVDHIDQYEDEQGCDDRSKAVRQLVKEGLKHSATPVHRWQSAIRNAAAQLVFVAIALTVVGYGTELVAPIQALQVSGLLVALAASVLATHEIVRKATAPTMSQPTGTGGDA